MILCQHLRTISAADAESITWCADQPTWSPDGRRLAFTLFGCGCSQAECFNIFNHPLTSFLGDGETEIDNGATERANREIALGRRNWTFFGSDGGGRMRL